MIDLKNYTYTDWEQLVIDKYGKEQLQDAITQGMHRFYIGIHDRFIPSNRDQSMIDNHESFVKHALDYIFQNDEELQNQHDVNICRKNQFYQSVASLVLNNNGEISTLSEEIT